MRWDAVGIGNAIMDALVVLESDDVLHELGLTRGIMHPVDDHGWRRVHDAVRHLDISLEAGGSGANTISTLGRLGAKVIHRGQVGDDTLGHTYAERLSAACGDHRLTFTPHAATGKCLSLISASDAERTMITDLGASVQLDHVGDFAAELGSTRLAHFEGYALLDGPLWPVVNESMILAKEAGAILSLDASDPFVIHAVRDRFWAVLRERIDIVFLNAEEARALTDEAPEDAAPIIAERARLTVVVVKLGARGAIVWHEGVAHHIEAERVHAVDTTGAGDSFAGGFLYGWLQGWGPVKSGRLAAAVAAATVSRIGAVVTDNDLLASIRARIDAAG